jgi:hypothetical protein
MTEVRDTGNAYKSVVDINIVHVPCSKIFLVFIPRTGQQIQRYTIIQQDCYMFRPFSAIFREVFEYLLEDRRNRPKHVKGWLYDCILLYLTILNLFE